MALTTSERKERYYRFVLGRANALCSSWGKRAVRSKQLVVQAKEYAFDKRLKTNVSYRFQVLVFTYALELRIAKRYGMLLRKIFHIFAFIRERKVLRYLKRVLGFGIYTAIREMIEAEAEKLLLQLSARNNRRPIGGGKRLGTDDLSIEEAFESFCEECIQEDLQQSDLDVLEKSKPPVKQEKSASVKTDDAGHERISVEELDGEKVVATDKETSRQQEKTKAREKLEVRRETKELPQSCEEEKLIEKTMGNSVVIPAEMIATQECLEEPPSPFPVFRDRDAERSLEEQQDSPTEEKEQTEKLVSNKDEKNQEPIRGETEEVKSPFPVFNKGQGGVAPALEKPMEQSVESGSEKPARVVEELAEKPEERPLEVEPVKEAKLKDGVQRGMKISEENKARIQLNTTMRDAQIQILATQIQESAKMTMMQEECEWREKISIAESSNGQQPHSREIASPPSGGVVQAPKK